MLLPGSRLTGTTHPVGERMPQPPSIEAPSHEVLITAKAVVFGTAAAHRGRREDIRARLAGALRRLFATAPGASRPRPGHYPERYGFLEQALLAREMDRL
jgi:hypothetical protein